MPRFFFHARHGVSGHDAQGRELATIAAAKREAACFAGRALLAHPEQLWNAEVWTVEVCDAVGLILFEVHCCAALSPALTRD